MFLHGWGVSNTVWSCFVDQFSVVHKKTTPCLYDLANHAQDYKVNSLANELSKNINPNSVIVAWSFGGLIATHLARLTDKVKGIVYIASTPCFINKENWQNVIDKESLTDLKKRLSSNTTDALKYFAGLVAHGDKSAKITNRLLRENLANEKHKEILSCWLSEMQLIDQRKEFAELKLPSQFIFGENDSLVGLETGKQLNFNMQHKVVEKSGHAPFISKPEETMNIINEFVNAKIS